MLALLRVIITKLVILTKRVRRCLIHFPSCFRISEFWLIHLYVCFCFALFIWHSSRNYLLADCLLEGSCPLPLPSINVPMDSLPLKASYVSGWKFSESSTSSYPQSDIPRNARGHHLQSQNTLTWEWIRFFLLFKKNNNKEEEKQENPT